MPASHPTVTDPVVQLTEVTVHTPRRPAPLLHTVTLSIAPGERMLLLGTSGAGKSTLLHTISGGIPHSVNADLSGQVLVNGRDTSASTVVDIAMTVGVLGQDPSSSVTMSQVDQEVAFPLENQGVPAAEITGRVQEALSLVGAAHLAGRGTSTLSGGELQRVALAGTLVGRPAVLLLDEPTAMLDAHGVTMVRAAVAAAGVDGAAGTAPAVVLVEHRLDELAGPAGLAGLPPRTVLLGDGGVVLADGPTVAVLKEQAATLHRAGCWLPLEAELWAVAPAVGPDDAETAPGPDDESAGRGGAPIADVRGLALLDSFAAPSGAAATLRATPTPGRTLLEGTGLSVSRDRVRRRTARRPGPRILLRDVDIRLTAGEIVAVLGANGCGKTSLLLTLAGLVDPAAGRIEGQRPGLVFQNPEHQFLRHTVAEEIGYGLPGSAADRAGIVAHRLAGHRLEHLADQNPHRLSGGEKRRLSLAAMLAHDRPVLLADEPTFGLDRRDTLATATALTEAAATGRGILFSSHDLRFVAALADRLLVLGDGRLLADGPIEAVLADADLLRTAGLTLPPLVSWLLHRHPGALRRTLHRLDTAPAVDPVPAVVS